MKIRSPLDPSTSWSFRRDFSEVASRVCTMCDLGGTLRVKESKKSRFPNIFFVCQVVERVEFGDQIENTTQVIQSDLFIPKS